MLNNFFENSEIVMKNGSAEKLKIQKKFGGKPLLQIVYPYRLQI